MRPGCYFIVLCFNLISIVILPTGIQFIGRNRIIYLALLSLSTIAITDSGLGLKIDFRILSNKLKGKMNATLLLFWA